MFRIEFFKLKGHPQLGDIELFLSEEDELKNVAKPYTSVIIGANGTGKSYILRTIAEVFRQLKYSSGQEKFEFNLPFDIILKYHIDGNSYIIDVKRIPHKKSRVANFLKNLPNTKDFNWDTNFTEEFKKHIVSHREIEFPNKLIVNSVMLTDRFVWQNSNPSDFYQYLGVRSTKTTSSTQTSARRTIKHLFSATSENLDFIFTLKELLKFLDFEENLKIHYSTKINKLFFSGNLTKENFKKYYEEWWEENFEFSKRKKENPLWSIPYYNNNFKDNSEATNNLIAYLNHISSEENRLEHKPNSSAKIISIDLFDPQFTAVDLEMLVHLENLDIVNLDGIKIKKSNSTLSINDLSSGEYHLLISLIGMFSSINHNSLVLMDEPEISLHPNWQMRYVSFLKKMFEKFANCHFILTTHSHFLVSDLEGESSSVTALKRHLDKNELSAKLLDGTNTYGWSAEDVLYNVFNVASTRNKFVAENIAELLNELSKGESNKINKLQKEKYDEIINLEKSLKENDPLKTVVKLIIKKINN